MSDKETVASNEYQENFDKSNEWLLEHAPKHVVDCIDEMVSYIEYLQKNLDERDDMLKRYEAVMLQATAAVQEANEKEEAKNKA